MKIQQSLLLLFISAIFILSSCEMNKKLKGTNEEKLTWGNEFYQAKNYSKALTLYDDIFPHYRTQEAGEQLQLNIAKCHFGQKDYVSAGMFFTDFAETYQKSAHTEEASYYAAYCYYLDSPITELDQSNTYKALMALQDFIAQYPESKRVAECNTLIDRLEDKLEEKSFNTAHLYYELGEYKLSYYKSSITALKSSLENYPDSKYREDILFYIFKSNYQIAINSIASKQKERYETAMDEYNVFNEKYPESKYKREADKMYEYCKRKIIQI